MESKIVASPASPHLAWGSGTLNVEFFFEGNFKCGVVLSNGYQNGSSSIDRVVD
jgi:hypothetical protein